MAFVKRLYKIQFGGRICTDEWSCGLHFVMNQTDTPPTVDQVADKVRAWFLRADTGAHQYSNLTYVKFNEESPLTGKYANTSMSYTLDLNPAVASPTSSGGAPQLTQVVSLRTAKARGRGHRGRFYPPGTASGIIGNNGQTQPAAALIVAQSAAEFIKSLNLLVTSGRVVVWSRLNQEANQVIGVTVDTVIDTQRRRRNKIVGQDQNVVVDSSSF